MSNKSFLKYLGWKDVREKQLCRLVCFNLCVVHRIVCRHVLLLSLIFYTYINLNQMLSSLLSLFFHWPQIFQIVSHFICTSSMPIQQASWRPWLYLSLNLFSHSHLKSGPSNLLSSLPMTSMLKYQRSFLSISVTDPTVKHLIKKVSPVNDILHSLFQKIFIHLPLFCGCSFSVSNVLKLSLRAQTFFSSLSTFIPLVISFTLMCVYAIYMPATPKFTFLP